ncbi:hypothetical protein JCM10213_008047 [Rhodosporidiobolus nylandii]
MVSFSCENCGDILKKPKLDQHAGRCRGAVFTCIDCNTTFQGTSYRAHTSCVSEEQRYHKSVYKPPKGKGQKGQKQQAQEPAPAPAPAPEAAAPVATTSEDSKKRAREDEEAAKGAEPAAVPEAALPLAEVKDAGASEEPKKKKSKKDKKKDKKAQGEEVAASATNGEASGEAKKVEEGESLSSFLSAVVSPLLAADSLSLSQLREKVLAAAKEKGRKEEQGELETKLWEGLKVGGKKQKVKAEFA